jgi:hypothetical protein
MEGFLGLERHFSPFLGLSLHIILLELEGEILKWGIPMNK